MIYNADNIRDVAILGHLGSGKTTLVEAFAYATNLIKQKGEIEKKNTISDYSDEEKARGSSINASVVPVYYNEHKINLIDLPGNDDFVGEILSVTRLVKGAILVIDASSGVQVGTIKHWRTLRRRNIPTIIYVNKMDKENINFENILNDIRTKLGKNAVPFTYPIGHESDFDGFVNVVDLKARKYNGVECVDDEIYLDKRAKVYELHNTICEAVASTNEELLEKLKPANYFDYKTEWGKDNQEKERLIQTRLYITVSLTDGTKYNLKINPSYSNNNEADFEKNSLLYKDARRYAGEDEFVWIRQVPAQYNWNYETLANDEKTIDGETYYWKVNPYWK